MAIGHIYKSLLLHRFLSIATENGTSIQFVQVSKCESVHYDPLTVDEAFECLSDLISKYHTAIDAYHCGGWAHMGIRLENVCFDVRFQPVLIDLDRSIRNVEPCTFVSDSCMYGKLTGEKTDYV